MSDKKYMVDGIRASAASPGQGATSASEEARFKQALEAAYPTSTSPHTSVQMRAADDRAAFKRGYEAALAGPAQAARASEAEQVQWRNIRKVVKELAKFCFGDGTQKDHISLDTAYVALTTALTAKDGLSVTLEPLLAGLAPAQEDQQVAPAPAGSKPSPRP